MLTFYQERIANEGFLRTATERRSILEMARAIGYELNPGVAASTYLVFKVDESASTPDTATIPAGTQVQSIPAAQGELPQTFETTEEFAARVAWNALWPRTTEPDTIEVDKTGLYLQGVSTQLQPGDAIVIVGATRNKTPQVTDGLCVFCKRSSPISPGIIPSDLGSRLRRHSQTRRRRSTLSGSAPRCSVTMPQIGG